MLSARADALAWRTNSQHRVAPLAIPVSGRTGFTSLDPASLNIHFSNRLSDELLARNSNLMNGSGVALGDVDGDGLCDIYFCRLEGGSILYRNLGTWKFEDVTARAGIACADQFTRGGVCADIDGDGDLDLVVTGLGTGTRCFLNDGSGRFREMTEAAGLKSRTGSTSLALADVDGNGTLDLYVANFGEISILRDGGQISLRTVNGRQVVTGRYANRLKIINGQLVEFGEPDVLYLNDGKGHFAPVPWNTGAFLDEDGHSIEAPWDFGLAAQIRDLNGDGFPDIYVCNDFQSPDRIWLGDGKGHFSALPKLAMRKMSYASMGVDFADIDRDEHLDFFVAEMLSRDHRLRLRQNPSQPELYAIGEIENRPQFSRNTLFWNRGDGTFAELAAFTGLAASDWSWTPVFLDVDLDGYEDLLVTNGHTHDMNDLDVIERLEVQAAAGRRKSLFEFPPLETPNFAFRNRGDLTFVETGTDWGFDSPRISHGMALADLDNDGDLDVVVNSLNAPPLILRNESIAPRLAVRLRGVAPNTHGIGAKLRIFGGAVPWQSQEVICGGRYLSGDDPMRAFAAGRTTNDLTIEVTWRSGRQTRVEHARPNCIYEVNEAGAEQVQSPKSKVQSDRSSVAGSPLSVVGGNEPTATNRGRPRTDNLQPATFNLQPLFTDVSHLLNHTHHEEPFDDFARQPLLPRKLSQAGPGVAWFDLDGDGHDELTIGSGRGAALVAFKFEQGKFRSVAASTNLLDDSTGLVGWADAMGGRALLAGISRYESGNTNAPLTIHLATRTRGQRVEGADNFRVSAMANPGPLAVADVDGDGNLDLFGGGQSIPGRYPLASHSALFHGRNGQLQLDAEQPITLAPFGIVTAASFTDLNGDGWPDLLLATSPGSLWLWTNEHGKLRGGDNSGIRLVSGAGFWNGIATGDFDGDGRLDIVAGNWGLNSDYQCDKSRLLRNYSADLNVDGVIELVEAFDDPVLGKTVPLRNLLRTPAASLFRQGRAISHRAFSEMSVDELFALNKIQMQELQVNTLASMLFLNRSDHFKPVPLPREAQFAPAFAVCVADMDGDGNEDVFLSQNFFATRPEDSRLDAGLGLWLRGDGKGRLTAVSAAESGVRVYGEQRGAAVGDFDEDARADLVVTQNGAATKLYRNDRAKPGLRVRLRGPSGNTDAIGAAVRLKFGGRFGPLREIQSGSGYLSQNSVVPVLATPEGPTEIWVRWPGGKVATSVVPANAKEVSVDSSGTLRVVK